MAFGPLHVWTLPAAVGQADVERVGGTRAARRPGDERLVPLNREKNEFSGRQGREW